MRILVIAAVLVLILDAGASKAATLVAGPLDIPPGETAGQLVATCRAINLSAKPITVFLELDDIGGNQVTTSTCPLEPGTGGCVIGAETGPAAVYCKAKSAKGRSAVRATLTVLRSDGNPGATAAAD